MEERGRMEEKMEDWKKEEDWKKRWKTGRLDGWKNVVFRTSTHPPIQSSSLTVFQSSTLPTKKGVYDEIADRK